MFRKIFNLLFSIMVLFMAIAISSCKKDDTPEPAIATITISSPTESAIFDYGSEVKVVGQIDFTDGLHGYQLIIRKKSDNSIQFEKDEHAHGVSIAFNESWTNLLNEHNDMELEVIAILDHDGNTVSKKVNFHCHH